MKPGPQRLVACEEMDRVIALVKLSGRPIDKALRGISQIRDLPFVFQRVHTGGLAVISQHVVPIG
jgi:hypothetical protein